MFTTSNATLTYCIRSAKKLRNTKILCLVGSLTCVYSSELTFIPAKISLRETQPRESLTPHTNRFSDGSC